MSDELDSNFRGWLDNLAEEWKVEVEQVVEWLGGVEENDEIENRQTYYPELRSSLLSSPLDIHKFAQVTHSCWALMGRYDVIRFNRFIEDDQGAIKAIQELIENFPNNEQEASQRIDNFVAKAVNLGYKRKPQESDDRPGAGATRWCI